MKVDCRSCTLTCRNEFQRPVFFSIDADIKASVSFSQTTSSQETYEFTIIVDPRTYVTLITRGQGEVSNGVAKSYFFWIETKKGGWETFIVTTEYYEIIKERI